jgi:hypothetical protein
MCGFDTRMAEITPSSRPELEDDLEPSLRSASLPRAGSESGARRPLRLIDPGTRASFPSHPPSDPRPLASRPGADATVYKPARVQLIAALLLLLVLVVVPLYLWRRPRAAVPEEAQTPTASVAASTVPVVDTKAPPDDRVRTRDGVTISDAKIIGCHDRGSKRTAPGACDRLPGVEAAIGKAILDSSSCIGPGSPPGAIAFTIDASYSRHKAPIHVTPGKEGTTMPARVVGGCIADVKKALSSVNLDTAHGHGRYEIEVDATYAGKR